MTAAELVQIIDGLWNFPIALPGNPLKWLNSYVIKGDNGGRNLVVDTGFNNEACLSSLMQGMESLSIDPANTDFFLTHLHSDHSGNAANMAKLGGRIIMGRTDYEFLLESQASKRTNGTVRLTEEGVSAEDMNYMWSSKNAEQVSSGFFPAVTVEDGEVLRYGSFELQCVCTPGHTPGHMCLYDVRKRTMLLGDHVLFDITPNISMWPGVKDSLSDYLNSLQKLRAYDVEYALPAHRTINTGPLEVRIDKLIAHHAARLDETFRLVAENPGLSAYQLAGKMTWHIRADSWESFPPTQKFFAVMEAIAHLDYLRCKGRVYTKDVDGVLRNFAR